MESTKYGRITVDDVIRISFKWGNIERCNGDKEKKKDGDMKEVWEGFFNDNGIMEFQKLHSKKNFPCEGKWVGIYSDEGGKVGERGKLDENGWNWC